MKISTIVSLTAFALSLGIASVNAAPTHPKISVQLWSVKDDIKNDFEGTIKHIAALGFQGVEFAGEFGQYINDPKGLKTFLKNNKLECSGAHVPFEKLNEENFTATTQFYKAVGCPYVIIPWDKRANSEEGIKQVAAELTQLSKKLKPLGIKTGYHNHDQEMRDLPNQQTAWDILAHDTPNEVILQQDVGWTTFAGKDPVSFVKKYPGRTLTTHYKAKFPEGIQGKLPIIGQDIIQWPDLVVANTTVGGTLWLTVEQEEYPNGMTPLQSVEASMKGLQKVLADLNAKK